MIFVACGRVQEPPLPSCQDLGAGEQCADDADVMLLGADGEWLGRSVAVGDLADDGADELVVTAPTRDARGAVLILPGSAEGLGAGAPLATLTLPSTGSAVADLLVHVAPDLDGDGQLDLLVHQDGDEGLVTVVSGPIGRDRGLDEAATAVIAAGDYPRSVGAVAGLGDADGDGFGDLVVGDPRNHDAVGYLHVFDGPIAGELSLEDADRVLWGGSYPLESGEEAGTSVDSAGDVDGDGLADLLVGAPGADEERPDHGAAYLVRGPIGDRTYLYDGDAVFLPDAHGDRAGERVAGVGDVDGDGRSDVAVGAPLAGAGVVYLLRGDSPGGALSLAALAVCTAPDRDTDAGATLAGGGDVDGDGLAELLVGGSARDGTDPGVVWVVAGGSAGAVDLATVPAVRGVTGPPGESFAGGGTSIPPTWADQLGAGLAAAGDLDGDGHGDLLLGAPGHQEHDGAVYLVGGASLL